MNTTDCIFCKIVAGELPSLKVYEDTETLAFLDIHPVNPGHTLVIPKAHHVNTFEAPEETWIKMTASVKKVAHAIKQGMGINDLNIVMNNGKFAGQVIFHAHIHIIPRHENDGHKLWTSKDYKEGEAAIIADQIKNAL